MAVLGRFLTSLFSTHKLSVVPNINGGTFLQSRNYALRQGTRERKEKIKKRNIELKAKRKNAMGPIKRRAAKMNLPDALIFRDVDPLRVSPDDVWISKYYNWKIYSFEEAVESHREILHPTVYNFPHAPIKALIEINMEGEKKTKPVSAFHDLVAVPHKFEQKGENREILAFAKTPEHQQEARDAGATFVAGTDAVRLIRIGEMSIADFHAIVAHPTILPELVSIKGILKRKFPSLRMGTLGPDFNNMIYKHLYGVRYSVNPYANYPTYAATEVIFGTLEMETKQLEENFRTLIENIDKHRPKRSGSFITRIRIKCLPSKELFKIDHTAYTVEKEEPTEEEDSDEEEDTVARAEV